jgi:hypothetical protein
LFQSAAVVRSVTHHSNHLGIDVGDYLAGFAAFSGLVVVFIEGSYGRKLKFGSEIESAFIAKNRFRI